MNDAGPPPSAGDSPSRRLTDVAALFTTLLGVFTALAGGAAVGGGIERVARDYPVQVVGGLLAFTGATVLAAAGYAFGRTARARADWTRALLVAAVVAFLLGLVLSYWAFVGTTRARSIPSVNATITTEDKENLKLQAEVMANGLSAHQYVRIKVLGTRGGATVSGARALYLANQGPDTKGEVDVRFDFPVRRGQYDGLLVKVWQAPTEPRCDIEESGLPRHQDRSDAFACVALAIVDSGA